MPTEKPVSKTLSLLAPTSYNQAASDSQQPAQQGRQEEQQQQLPDMPDDNINITRTSSTGFLDSLAAVISNKFGTESRDSSPVSGASAGLAAADVLSSVSSASASPKVGEQSLGPFAKARNLMAQREESTIARLKVGRQCTMSAPCFLLAYCNTSSCCLSAQGSRYNGATNVYAGPMHRCLSSGASCLTCPCRRSYVTGVSRSRSSTLLWLGQKASYMAFRQS